MWRALVAGVFPADVAVAWDAMGSATAPLLAEEEALMLRAVAKRQHEFALGRGCARRALAELGLEPGALLVGAKREPLWPPGVVGSIAHDVRLCVAVAARSNAYAGVGVDVEPDEPLSTGVAARIWSPEEAARAEGVSVVPPASAAKLVFSAKEAVYKCQFPITREFIGFRGVRVTLGDGTFEAVFLSAVGPLESGRRFSGQWRRHAGELLTAVWLEHAE
jgi:enterobactin synthetase component D